MRFNTNKPNQEQHFCPHCDESGKKVPQSALNSFIQDEKRASIDSLENFYFCETAPCSVVYFKNDFTFKQNDLKKSIGIKEGAVPATICYCFDWSKERIKAQIKQTGTSTALEDITLKKKTIGCQCEINNPKGKCCLPDIKKVIKELTIK